MGLLDDAIREHLELKRAHGADPTEVERQEREALGAPRGGQFADAPGEEPPAAVAAGEAGTVAEPAELPEPAEPPEPGPTQPPTEIVDEDEQRWFADEPDEVPASEALQPPPPPAEEPEEADDVPDESDDVLEETPEFLQETPEHERLWFEQRPPRDFDWDK